MIPSDNQIFPAQDFQRERQAMTAVRTTTKAPVPTVLAVEPDASILGAPFLVMERHYGRVPADDPVFTTTGWLLERSPEEQAQLYDNAIGTLAEIHRAQVGSLPINFHGASRNGDSTAAGIEVRGETATGVRLSDGHVVSAKTVLCTVDPWTMCHTLLPPGALPDDVYRQLRGMRVLGTNMSNFKPDVAISAAPKMPRHGREDELLPGVILMAPSLDYVRGSTTASLRGELTDEIPLWMGIARGPEELHVSFDTV